MTLKIARRGSVAPFIVMDVLRAANERALGGADVLHLELGQPATPAPAGVIRAAKAALDAERIGYTEALGLDALRGRISGHYRAAYGIDVPASRIAVTTGSSAGFILAFLSAFDAGDRVALAEPGYPAYRNILEALGIEPVPLTAEANDRYQPTVALLEALDRPVDGLIVASPSNPTGAMLREAELAALAAYCARRGIRLISDEIYHGITYGGPAATALRHSDDAVVVNSFSKYFSMTGWRVGWMVLPPALVRPVECLAQNLFISAPALSQHAAIAAFDCRAELDANVARYAANRSVLIDGLRDAGIGRLAPADGAFYLYAEIGHLTNDSEAFCRRLLAETGIALSPGTDFDRSRGRATVRISFAGPEGDMAEAVTRLKTWLARRP